MLLGMLFFSRVPWVQGRCLVGAFGLCIVLPLLHAHPPGLFAQQLVTGGGWRYMGGGSRASQNLAVTGVLNLQSRWTSLMMLVRHGHPVQNSQPNCCRAGGQWETPQLTQGNLGSHPSPSKLPASHTGLLLFLALARKSSVGKAGESSTATSAQCCWYAGGGGSRATSRTVKNY